jgi:hypothetical protein
MVRRRRLIPIETVEDLGVITPLSGTKWMLAPTFGCGILTVKGSHGPLGQQFMDRPAGAGPIRGFKPQLRKAPQLVEALRTPEDLPIPPNALDEMRRDLARLAVKFRPNWPQHGRQALSSMSALDKPVSGPHVGTPLQAAQAEPGSS